MNTASMGQKDDAEIAVRHPIGAMSRRATHHKLLTVTPVRAGAGRTQKPV